MTREHLRLRTASRKAGPGSQSAPEAAERTSRTALAPDPFNLQEAATHFAAGWSNARRVRADRSRSGREGVFRSDLAG